MTIQGAGTGERERRRPEDAQAVLDAPGAEGDADQTGAGPLDDARGRAVPAGVADEDDGVEGDPTAGGEDGGAEHDER